MAVLNNKTFLDFEGLSKYDALIKEYVDKKNPDVQQVINELAALGTRTTAVEALAADNKKAIDILNGTDEGSISKQIDTLKAYVDTQDETNYNLIQSITTDEVNGLF